MRSRFKQEAERRRQRRAPIPAGFDARAYEERARIAREQMRKVDLMPPEYRALVHEYGMKVRAMMRDGMTVEQIRDALS